MNRLTVKIKELFKKSPNTKLLSKEDSDDKKLSINDHSIAVDHSTQEDDNLTECSENTDDLYTKLELAEYYILCDHGLKNSPMAKELRDSLTKKGYKLLEDSDQRVKLRKEKRVKC